MPFFAAVKDAKLRSFVTPGQELIISAKLVHLGSGFAVSKAEIRSSEKLVANAEITFRLVEFPNPEFRTSMRNIRESLAKMAEGLLPVIDTELPLAQYEQALARLESRQVFGKIVISL